MTMNEGLSTSLSRLNPIGPSQTLSSTRIFEAKPQSQTPKITSQQIITNQKRKRKNPRTFLALGVITSLRSSIPIARRSMATMTNAVLQSPVAGLGASLRRPSKSNLASDFIRSSVIARNPLKQTLASGGRFTCFKGDWLRTDLNVLGFGLIGWLAPSSIPAIGGKSLTGLFLDSIGSELSHWPTGPALGSQFWLWLITWHFGLFVCLTFGQIGFKGRNEGYF